MKLSSLLRVMLYGVVMVIAVSNVGAARSAEERLFTVRDSIEMSHFDRIDPSASFSPDGRYFTVVSSRGIVATNQVESTLWLFRTDEVRHFLVAGEVMRPRPQVWVRIACIPRSNFQTSYASMITSVWWLPGSNAVLFLGEDSRGEQRLYRIDLHHSRMEPLSPIGYDVRHFAVMGDRVLYEGIPLAANGHLGAPINAAATDVTGLSISSILFLSANTSAIGGLNELWLIANGIAKKIGSDGTPLRVVNNVDEDTLAPSPDGRFAIIAVPVRTIPLSWSIFEPALPELRIDPNDRASRTSPDALYALAQYAILDMETGKIKSLSGGPMTWGFGWGFGGARWLRDGSHVIVLDSYLPGSPEPCLAAMVDIDSMHADCISFAPNPQTTAQLVQFGSNENDVILKVWDYLSSESGGVEKEYRKEGNSWEPIVPSNLPVATAKTPISVSFSQDLNTPPALWVSTVSGSNRKKLWDPNPQLQFISLGQASLLHWRDSSGYTWTAGMVKPPNYIAGKRYPLVIQAHGFLPGEFLSDGMFTTAFAARPLAASGIVVVQMGDNDRHIVSTKEPLDELRGYESLIKILDQKGIIDPQKVGMIGFSRTSWYTESTLIDDPHLLAAASITDGVDESYMQSFFFHTLGREAVRIYGGLPYGNSLSAWIRNAAGFNLDRVRAPLLITGLGAESILGEWEIYASLRMQHKPVDLMYLPEKEGYEHILQRPLDRLASQQTNVDWFRYWLQGYEDPNPLKTAQYRRWETLRKLQGGD